jgi:hypothetical protein
MSEKRGQTADDWARRRGEEKKRRRGEEEKRRRSEWSCSRDACYHAMRGRWDTMHINL